jgi:uncharacterized protein (TIGR04551 family)
VKRVAAFAVVLGWASMAGATGFSDYGQDLRVEPERVLDADGYLRLRASVLHNLDLDRGATPSGELFYPVPLGGGQLLSLADMRLRSDLRAYWPDGGVAVKARIDALDNIALGSAPTGIPAASTSQRGEGAVVVKRAYGEVLTPLGLLAGGRMGSHWGLGMLTNGGDCLDCDSGDAADRIAFIAPMLGHVWAVAWDFTAAGPFVPHRAETHAIDIAPTARVHTFTFAGMKWRGEAARERRRHAGKYTFDYGAYVSHRWQSDDVPATYVPTAQPVAVADASLAMRGYRATALDGWLRLEGPGVKIEAEVAYLNAAVDDPSLVPGVRLRGPVTSNAVGAALQARFGDPEDAVNGGLDAGVASGDRAPGFGAFPGITARPPRPGDLDGPQARPPFDTTVDNFRFHPDYRVDRILFREIIGTVTDAAYFRPHVRWALWQSHRGTIAFDLAAVVSLAVHAESTPGGEHPLGVEIDPSLVYESRYGFGAALEQATLVPLGGLDNPGLGLDARPAQLWRVRLHYEY